MARQKYYVGKHTKTIDCPCGYRINSSTERERDFKRKLHMRNCDRALYINKTPRDIHRANITPLNVAIDKNLEKHRNRAVP